MLSIYLVIKYIDKLQTLVADSVVQQKIHDMWNDCYPLVFHAIFSGYVQYGRLKLVDNLFA